MLHAISKGKSRLHRRYLGRREEGEAKVFEEDEITSAVLGPLDFLPAQDVFRFWSRVLHSTGHSVFLPSSAPLDVSLTLWDRRSASNDGNSIEPDGVIKITTVDGDTFILLLELKWRAGLSGEDQLHRQWKYFLTKTERTQALHLFIAPEITAGAQAPSNDDAGGDVWASPEGSRLVLLPWMRIRTILNEFKDDKTSALGRWATLADQFLEKIGIRKFSGFSHIDSAISLPAKKFPYLFWNPHRFSGWVDCGAVPVLPNSLPTSLFFTQ